MFTQNPYVTLLFAITLFVAGLPAAKAHGLCRSDLPLERTDPSADSAGTQGCLISFAPAAPDALGTTRASIFR